MRFVSVIEVYKNSYNGFNVLTFFAGNIYITV